ncbi:efflux RND transporter permease subunit [Burkholderia gladioli pv. gladioli]|uniref:Heavy metal efflux pump, CzcA family protein n=1 Tax=Burkholderia gladioli TaxID=28095 RepID=A0AAW3F711_BURGA|nr:efflux RND transporter permease subunit [Burkholderia gladioli]AJW94615.1 heavy metal efflux pump, CzcA family protein [Burkholderia gladioli]ASD81691.1 CusA/CzcA family heavy metal efflux RND transporter [Burkholderia gladioli pv. gladioli]AWY51944.1 CusA/CzcA family heavy metal efflux RND transporter [Burkholderia gladioli pv. gladioli]KGC15636.1 heavy metal efflux pump, CzcA family protein [Burkholderia gladioli]MDJ1165766.1 efflux RND transporter permease subunit [Burkholderia gladioli 
MIAHLIRWSIRHRLLVLLATLLLAAWGLQSLRETPLDALPDLSDTQVIIKVSYPGQAPQLIEDQVTYPLTTTLLGVPGAKTIRAYSSFGDAFVYVLFDDKTDPYWARSRVLESLNQVQGRLPPGATVTLGPDATGVGWVYEYALVDRSGRHDLGQLRALNDWFLRFELKTVPDVSEVASLGGMVRQYQVVLDPDRMRAYGVTQAMVTDALARANREAGGSVVEMAESEYVVHASGYLRTLDDFRQVVLRTNAAGTPLLLGDVARIQIGPDARRGVVELDGQGEVAGGVVVMRSGKNALSTIEGVKAKLAELKRSLPAGVEIVTTYDRSGLIERAVDNLEGKLVEEFVIVALVCALFLFHLRSALVAILSLPLGVLAAFIVMRHQGINANLMSLGGIAIAIGAMIDAAIVMIENAHKHLEAHQQAHPGEPLTAARRWELIAHAAAEVGPALFFSLLIITLSFVPVFTLEGQEGRLFAPLAYTKTYTIAAAAGLSVTLVPVLMGYLIRGRIPPEHANPINRWLTRLYAPLIAATLRRPWVAIGLAALALLLTAIPLSRLGGEFMPPLDEGDLLYMPTALPGISVDKAAELLQQTDRLIRTVPEVETVFGKSGRADSATDPAPLEMFETTIRFKPRSQWRPGMTPQKLVDELDRIVRVPGLSNVWVPPIRNRLDMLSTGIKTPVGVKITGPELAGIDRVAAQVEQAVKGVPGVSSALAERLNGGRYIDVDIDRLAAARYGLSVAELQSFVTTAIGGENLGEVIAGRERYPISVRYPREVRDSLDALRQLPVLTERGAQLRLGDVARLSIADGPPMIRSENARLAGYVYIDIRDTDLRSAVLAMQRAVARQVTLPPGYSIAWSGQFEYLERAAAKLRTVVPVTLAVIFVLLLLTFGSAADAALLMSTVPFALVGGFWLIWLLGHAVSVATAVGFIALAGVAAEFGVVMLLYLKGALQRRLDAGEPLSEALLAEAIREGAVQRVRPKAMTVAVVLAGLVPILLGQGTGSEVMQRIAAPMVGGMITAPLLSMFVIPAAWFLLQRRRVRLAARARHDLSPTSGTTVPVISTGDNR